MCTVQNNIISTIQDDTTTEVHYNDISYKAVL